MENKNIKQLRKEMKGKVEKDRTFKGFEVRKLIEELFDRVEALENERN